jgi:hypothetical protein
MSLLEKKLAKYNEFGNRLKWIQNTKRHLLDCEQKLELDLQFDRLEAYKENLEKDLIAWYLSINIEDM